MSTNTYLQGVASKLVLSDTERVSIRNSINTLELHLRHLEHYDSIEYHDYLGLSVAELSCQGSMTANLTLTI